MNKKIIWLIVGLMSVAVIGVIWSQMQVVTASIKTLEKQFDHNVREALNTVARQLEREEQREIIRYTANGFSMRFLQGKNLSLKTNNHTNLRQIELFSEGSAGNGLDPKTSNSILDQFVIQLSNDYICQNCLQQRNQLFNPMANDFQTPLVDRGIEPEKLKQMLDVELANMGIHEEYHFGVFSEQNDSWLLVDNRFLVEEPGVRDFLPGVKPNKDAKPYETALFRQTYPPPGYLSVVFPNKTSFLWRSLGLNLFSTIFFAFIIIGCFAYSVNVIFQQKKLSEMKTDFINNMTHEFKTPIATISLAADSISSPMISGSPDKIKRFANIIQQENRRMNNQVEKVLQMALLDKRQFSLKISDINLHEIIESAIENITLQIEKRDGTVSTSLEAENPVIQGDVTHISNIINNLLDNANKYSPEKPDISVSTKNLANGVEVVVKDKGIGMSKEARKHIFDKFYRVHTGNLHDVKGFGLGLSYVKAMITAHKGMIDVKSELGKGSSFILLFPYKQ